MADVDKILANAMLGTTLAAIGTVPSSPAKIWRIKEIEWHDISGVDRTVKLFVAGAVAVTATRARETNVVTLTTSAAHGLTTGDRVNVLTVGGTGYNVSNVALASASGSTLTYANTGSDESSTADTAGRIILAQTELVSATVLANDTLDKTQGFCIPLTAGQVIAGYSDSANAVNVFLFGEESDA
jgi:hypothetical protein